jgi:hypothetical protein
MMVCGTIVLLGGLRAISLASLDICGVLGFAPGAAFCEATLVAVFALGAVFFTAAFAVFLLGVFLVAMFSLL